MSNPIVPGSTVNGTSAAPLNQPGQLDEAPLKLKRSSAFFWFIVVLLLYIFDILDMVAVSAVFPAMKAEYGLTDMQLGWLAGSRGLAALLLVVPVGMLVDRWSRKYMISIMAVVWSFFCWATAWMGNFPGLLFARFMVGAGGAGYNTAGYALIGAWFPKRLRGTMTGLFNMGQPIGAFVGVGLAGWLAVRFGWKSVFGIMAIPGFFLAALMLFAPDYKAKKVETASQTGEAKTVEAGFNLKEALSFIMKSPTILMLYLAQLGMGFWTFTFTNWLPSFFGRTFSLDMAQAGSMVMFVGVAAIIGAPIGGWLSDVLVKKYVNGRILATIILTIWSGVLWTVSILMAMQGYGLWPVAITWFLAQPGWAGMSGAAMAAAIDVSPIHFRAFAMSFLIMLQSLAGFIGPIIAGAISDTVGLTMAMLLTMLISIVFMLIVFFIANRNIARDLERQEALGTFTLNKA